MRALLDRRPVLTLAVVALGLLVGTGAVGTASYLAGLSGYLPLVLAFGPIATVLAIVLTVARAWRRTGFRRPSTTGTAMAALVLPLFVVVPVLADGFLRGGIGVFGAIGFAALAALVAFVEETLFRGVFLQRFLRRSVAAAVVAPSVAFAVAHTAIALSPDSDGPAVLRTVLFAFAFGIVASLATLLCGSIWPAVALHAAFDLAGFLSAPSDPVRTDLLALLAAAVVAVALLFLARRGGREISSARSNRGMAGQ